MRTVLLRGVWGGASGTETNPKRKSETYDLDKLEMELFARPTPVKKPKLAPSVATGGMLNDSMIQQLVETEPKTIATDAGAEFYV